jgi:hypothetical protein
METKARELLYQIRQLSSEIDEAIAELDSKEEPNQGINHINIDLYKLNFANIFPEIYDISKVKEDSAVQERMKWNKNLTIEGIYDNKIVLRINGTALCHTMLVEEFLRKLIFKKIDLYELL